MNYVTSLANVFVNYDVDKYLYGYGLCTNPDYRNRGIATEVLKARPILMKALGLKLTSTAFTAIGSQVAASKAGFEETLVLSYADLELKFPGWDFSDSPTKNYKQMSFKI